MRLPVNRIEIYEMRRNDQWAQLYLKHNFPVDRNLEHKTLDFLNHRIVNIALIT